MAQPLVNPKGIGKDDREFNRAFRKLKADALNAFDQLRSDTRKSKLLAALASRSAFQVAEAIPWNRLDGHLEPLKADIRQIFEAEAVLAAKDVGISFDIFNPRVMDWISSHTGELIREVMAETRKAVQVAAQQMFESGESTKWMADQILPRIGLTTKQTMAVENYRKGLSEMGLKPGVLERRVDLYRDRLLKFRAENIARTECLPAETLVDGAVIGAIHRRWYEGDMVEVVTRNGRKFTASPNHPMLTGRGWLGAGKISIGDDLVCYVGNQGLCSSGNKNIQTGPSTLGEIFDSINAVGIAERRSCSEPDFHGDGRKGYVDILTPRRVLNIGRFSPIYKPLGDDIFSKPNLPGTSFCLDCGRLLPINKPACTCTVADGNAILFKASNDWAIRKSNRTGNLSNRLTGKISPFNLFCRQIIDVIRWLQVPLFYQQFASFGCGPSNASIMAYPTNPPGVGFSDACNLNHVKSREIQLDDVVSVRLRSFSGHVFNLSSVYSYYTINQGLYTGNTINAAAAGQQMAWEQAVASGDLDARRFEVRWSTSPSDACPICIAMNGQRRPISGTYPGGQGPPTKHPSCRCIENLVPVKSATPQKDFYSNLNKFKPVAAVNQR